MENWQCSTDIDNDENDNEMSDLSDFMIENRQHMYHRFLTSLLISGMNKSIFLRLSVS